MEDDFSWMKDEIDRCDPRWLEQSIKDVVHNGVAANWTSRLDAVRTRFRELAGDGNTGVFPYRDEFVVEQWQILFPE